MTALPEHGVGAMQPCLRKPGRDLQIEPDRLLAHTLICSVVSDGGGALVRRLRRLQWVNSWMHILPITGNGLP